MKNKIYIYGLSGNDGVIRYVGQSYRPLIRKTDHLSQAKRGVISHKNNWIRKLLNNGDSINIHILEECDVNNWIEREKYWIGKIPNLTNKSDGGEGSSGSRYKTSLEELKIWVKENVSNINSESKWREWVKNNELPNCFPKRPDYVYRDSGWVSWSDFFNTKINYLSYQEIKDYVVKNKISSMEKYIKIRKENMPYNPAYFYKDSGWVSWYDFLNKQPRIKKINKIKKTKLICYSDAKLIIKPFNLTTKKEYTKWYLENKGLGLPRNPKLFYKNEWCSYNDFFGNTLPKNINYKGKIKSTHFLTYYEAKQWVDENCNIKSENIWRGLTNALPSNIPKRPDYVYRDSGWVSWSKFLRNN